MKQLKTVEQIEQILSSKETCLILKHSTTCPISAAAYQEVQKFEPEASVPIYLLTVIEDRPASNYLAEATGITHQSPQAIYLSEGNPKWNDSHWSITKDSLVQNVK